MTMERWDFRDKAKHAEAPKLPKAGPRDKPYGGSEKPARKPSWMGMKVGEHRFLRPKPPGQ